MTSWASGMTYNPELCIQQILQRGPPEHPLQVSEDEMDAGTLLGKGYLELLESEVDDWVLSQEVEEVAELPTGPSHDTLNDADVFYTVEGEEVCQCSNTGEAYDKIAGLAEYVLKDHQEKPVEELFGSCSDAPEPKRRKTAHSPAVHIVNGASIVSGCPIADLPQSNFHVQFLVTTIAPVGRPPKSLGSSASPNLEYCLLSPKDIQVILTAEPLVQQINWPPRPGDARGGNYSLGEGLAVREPPKSLLVPSEQTHKRPESVDDFCTELKRHFQAACQSGQMERETSLDRLYIEGDLAQLPTEPKSGRNMDPRPGDPEEKGKKALVERKQLFQTPGRKDPGTKVIVVLGKAGMGKSLLAQKICLEWSNGQWPEYDFVFRFDCRRLNVENRQNLRTLLFERSAQSQEELDKVYGYILHNPEKVLLIFDGFEELKDQDGFAKQCPESPPHGEPCGLTATLAGLFQKKVLNGCTLLLTARPKDKQHQCLPRADKILELMGFSTQQAELYLARYFEGLPTCDGAVSLIRNSPYFFSHCHHPELCRFICESVFQTGGKESSSTLTGLFVKSLLQTLAGATEKEVHLKHRCLASLAQMAWNLEQNHQHVFTSSHFASGEVREFALDYRLVVPFPFLEKPSSGREEHGGFVFSSFVVQNFLLALHLVLAKEIRDKKLTQHLRLLSRSKRSLSSSWDLVPRFLSGLLSLEETLISPFLFGEEAELDVEKMVTKKQKNLSKYIRKLPIRDFSPDRLLELFHCVHEMENTYLLQHLALELRPDLSFLGVSLTSSNVYVLCSILRRCTKKITLDFRGCSVDLEGLRQLVTMKNVSAFRACLSHAIELWKYLWESEEEEQLQSATEKFISVPFKIQTMKDVDELSALVHLQEDMAGGQMDSSHFKIHHIPAITDLRQLEYMMEPVYGLKGFQKLVQILDAFPALQHLDFDSPKENEIGDEGVLSFCDVLPRLRSLETLNLSRNKITDVGAERLSAVLPSLPSLKTLSLYNNSIGDAGAEHFAKTLPQMPSLRVLDIHCNKITVAGAQRLTNSVKQCPWVQSVALWSPTIPHGVLDHLQHLDSRIRLL